MTEANQSEVGLSRRGLFRAGGLVGGVVALAGCSSSPGEQVPPEMDVAAPDRTPLPPTDRPRVYEFFTLVEASVVDAVVDRIIPGDEQGPGAREAGVTTYIDGKLAGFEAYAEPTYRQAPFAESYSGSPPADPPDDVVPVAENQLYRYGHQSSSPPQATYRKGLAGLDTYCRQRFQQSFAELDERRQDTVLEVLDAVRLAAEGASVDVPRAERNAASDAFGEVDAGAFFGMVRDDTVQGMFADPAYGGNRGLAGWTMIGFPGPQRAYSPQEMKTGTSRRPQSMDGLPPMNPGRHGEHGIDPMKKPRSGVGAG